MNDIDSEDTKYVYPFLEDIKNTGYSKLMDSECQKRLFCKMAAYGGHSEDANGVQKAFYHAPTLWVIFNVLKLVNPAHSAR